MNAGLLSGIVTTTSSSNSGGAEHIPRVLEDWTGDTLTYNGFMVGMYESRYATGLWQGTGSTIGIYSPPTRKWAFDLNFHDPTKLLPGTPQVRTLIRGLWTTLKLDTTS